MLSDDDVEKCRQAGFSHGGLRAEFCFESAARAIESAACAERDARIAELEAANEAFGKRQEWWNARMLELEQQLAEARKDAELLDYIQTNGATVEIIPGAPDFYPVHFRVGGRYRTANESIRAAIRAAIKEQT